MTGLPKITDGKKELLLSTMKRGDHFGIESAFKDLPNPFTVEAATSKVELYKIHRAHFFQHFGGIDGDQAAALRGSLILRQNWFKMKTDWLQEASSDILESLGYRDEAEHAKRKPTKTNPKEVPFMKNNPKAK